jgi:hypothetical protein
VVVRVTDVPVPVIVIVEVPVGVIGIVMIVSVEEVPAVIDAGVNVALTPGGSPDALSDTVCAEPDVTAVETVVTIELPLATEPEAGLTEMAKSSGGTGLTVRE